MLIAASIREGLNFGGQPVVPGRPAEICQTPPGKGALLVGWRNKENNISVCAPRHRRSTRLATHLLATFGDSVVALPVFRMTGKPFLPDPTMITFELGDSASFSVASIPFHSITRSFSPLLMIS